VARFKIGARVRVISTASGNHGRTGTITGVQHTSPDARATQGQAVELFRGYAVDLDGGQIELFLDLDLEAE